MKTLQIEIFGRVQGVWFRASAKKQADILNLHGFVMNRPDGSVYIEVSGPKQKIDVFVAWCRQGPPAAEVTKVVLVECPNIMPASNDFIVH